MNIHWKDSCWSWSSKTLATWCKELIHWKRPWCWERLRAGGGGDDRGWVGWIASPTQWTWVWVDSRNWWWTGRPGVLRFKGSQRIGHEWATKLNWTACFRDQPHYLPWLSKALNPLIHSILQVLDGIFPWKFPLSSKTWYCPFLNASILNLLQSWAHPSL